MDLNDFWGPKPIVIDLHAENRWEAIDELIDQLVVHHKIKAEHRDANAESVRKVRNLNEHWNRDGHRDAARCHRFGG